VQEQLFGLLLGSLLLPFIMPFIKKLMNSRYMLHLSVLTGEKGQFNLRTRVLVASS